VRDEARTLRDSRDTADDRRCSAVGMMDGREPLAASRMGGGFRGASHFGGSVSGRRNAVGVGPKEGKVSRELDPDGREQGSLIGAADCTYGGGEAALPVLYGLRFQRCATRSRASAARRSTRSFIGSPA
jgi:hypothetical protein